MWANRHDKKKLKRNKNDASGNTELNCSTKQNIVSTLGSLHNDSRDRVTSSGFVKFLLRRNSFLASFWM